MNPLSRIALLSGWALACLGARASAQGGFPLAAPTTAAAPLALAALPQWSVSASAESSFGFKDNLLLSFAAEERSAFARGLLETVLMRVPTGSVDYWLFAQAEGTHYFSGRTVHNEAKVWIHNELGWRASDAWKLGLPVTAYYNDTVLDQSDTEVERLAAEIKVAGAMAAPVVRWTFQRNWWLETQATAQRESYADGSNNGRVARTALRLGWNLSPQAEIRLGGEQRWRDFDTRAQYSAAGRELAGTRLKIAEDEGEVRLKLKWGRAAQWQSTTHAGFRHYRDNGSGYFNYRERKLDQEWEWSGGPWLVRLSGGARRMDFDVQTVGIGIAPPARRREEFEARVRAERKLNARWIVFGGFSWERSRSNDTVASYVVNEGLLGVRWNWEK